MEKAKDSDMQHTSTTRVQTQSSLVGIRAMGGGGWGKGESIISCMQKIQMYVLCKEKEEKEQKFAIKCYI